MISFSCGGGWRNPRPEKGIRGWDGTKKHVIERGCYPKVTWVSFLVIVKMKTHLTFGSASPYRDSEGGKVAERGKLLRGWGEQEDQTIIVVLCTWLHAA